MDNQQTPPAPIQIAFAKALNQVGIAIKDSRNPHFGNAYASLNTIQEIIHPALKDENLVLNQLVDYRPEEQCVAVTTYVWGIDGSNLCLGTTRLPVPKLTPQDAGSAMTYARRYALIGLFGIQVVDDDSEAAMRPTRVEKPAPASKPPAAKWEADISGEEAEAGSFIFKGKTRVLKDMSLDALQIVTFTGSYPDNIRELTKLELIRRSKTDDKAMAILEANG